MEQGGELLLGLRASLPSLRRESSPLVRAVHRYCPTVRLLPGVHAGRTACLLPPVCSGFPCRRLGGLPVLVHEVSRRARAL
jgi:hypothetical protein